MENVIFAGEAELLVQALKDMSLPEIGSLQWHKQHDYIEKLNMQAILSASNQTDEFVKDFLVNYKKLPTIVFDALLTEVWLDKVYPRVVQLLQEIPQVTFPLYLIAYHEAILVNLMETMLYHQDALESLEDMSLDLVDYCYRKLCHLCGPLQDPDLRQAIVAWRLAGGGSKEDHSSSPLQELTLQRQALTYEMALKTISLMRYFIDYLSDLPPGVGSRLLNHYDVPLLLVQLLESTPWIVEKSDQEVYKYLDNSWHLMTDSSQLLVLNKLEGQIWISIYQLLLGDVGRQGYLVHDYRKSILLRLRRMMTEPLMDQLPCLLELRRYLEQLGMMQPPPAKKDLILELTAEIQTRIVAEYESQWDKLASKYVEMMQSEEGEAMLRNQARDWVAIYEHESVLDLVEPPKCTQCGEQASKRCSRCRKQWYCGRECQVKHWPQHKLECGQPVKPSSNDCVSESS